MKKSITGPEAQAREIERLLDAMRRIYPQRINAGQLERGEAERQLTTMEAVLYTIRDHYGISVKARIPTQLLLDLYCGENQ